MKGKDGTLPEVQSKLDKANSLIEKLINHLEYCGWGDSWERECSEELRKEAYDYMSEQARRSDVKG